MIYNPSYKIAIEQGTVVVRFDRNAIDETALSRFLDYLELQSIRKRSQLSEDQAATLAAEINRSVWDTLKDTFADK